MREGKIKNWHGEYIQNSALEKGQRNGQDLEKRKSEKPGEGGCVLGRGTGETALENPEPLDKVQVASTSLGNGPPSGPTMSPGGGPEREALWFRGASGRAWGAGP